MAEQYDLVVFKIGYNKFLMPKKAAFVLFDILSTQDVYKLDEKWISEKRASELHVKGLDTDEYPTISTFTATQFLAAKIAYEEYQAALRAKEEAKAVQTP